VNSHSRQQVNTWGRSTPLRHPTEAPTITHPLTPYESIFSLSAGFMPAGYREMRIDHRFGFLPP